MNTSLFTKKLEKFAFFIFTLFSGVIAFAQETAPKVEVTTTTTKTEEWYANPVYIIIGAILFIILVAVLVRGGRSSKD
ncbi:hypothetical protein [Chryseobacterium oryzae]|uniref:Uncharacterized protein n=1 Tax=Chryseobacterium oryzae TaxID=2929799 RepID=A0ABY4BG30_9FLAO|nr:hypothetical protein [Chryseobacterium oryzae]UOE38135.1 hypothetical protein MTP08_13945 [Chryseobacterium oryzae]